ncbi:MAG: hypothetical protein JW815_03715 [Candidatus Bathyarchaeota archaeon]|nr:hypothetical protein [Candidatus Bathyarchaeum sp.]
MATLTKASEICKNPWNGKCKNSDIQVYIYYKNKRVPICRKCWSKIAEKDIEWLNVEITKKELLIGLGR